MAVQVKGKKEDKDSTDEMEGFSNSILMAVKQM